MAVDLHHLRGALEEAITILEQDATPMTARVDHTLAILYAALVYHADLLAVHESIPKPAHALPNEGEQVDDDLDADDISFPAPRRLADYRRERAMHIPAFTAFLGITHADYAAVVRRHALDRRLRDQIAYKLGVQWQEIAEFMPEPPPQPRPQPAPIPASDDAPPPLRPWYLFDDETGRILSGPHTTPVPQNGYFLSHPLLPNRLDLIVLHDFSGYTEEDQLLPDAYTREELQEKYPDWDFATNTYVER
jgi:hypothetical protein